MCSSLVSGFAATGMTYLPSDVDSTKTSVHILPVVSS